MRDATRASVSVPAHIICVLSAGLLFVLSDGASRAAQASEPSLQQQGDALMKNVEDMLAHGGMGDSKAIVHHCHEAARYAGTLLAQVPETDPRRATAVMPLNRVIEQCRRVSDIGVHADPGLLLNPAIKARAAALESVTLLGLAKANRN
jgi:hypothetical protein